jgi:glycosyltransferase involved in cell wall biosynthesis
MSGQTSPLVSIVVTAYNRERFLASALNSALSQSAGRDEYEVILVTNLATPQLDRLCDADRVKIIRKEGTIGQFLATGIRESQGSIITFLDDDDQFSENKVTHLIQTFRQYPLADYFHNEQSFVDEAGRPFSSDYKADLLRGAELRHAIYLPIDHSDGPFRSGRRYCLDFNMSSISVRRDLADRVSDSLGAVNSCQDGSVFFLAVDRGRALVASPLRMTTYRVHYSQSRPATDSQDDPKAASRDTRQQMESLARVRAQIHSARVRRWIDYSIAVRSIREQLLSRTHQPGRRSILPYVAAASFWYRDGYGAAMAALGTAQIVVPRNVLRVFDGQRGKYVGPPVKT